MKEEEKEEEIWETRSSSSFILNFSLLKVRIASEEKNEMLT